MKHFVKVIGLTKDVLETNIVKEVNRDNVESALEYIGTIPNKDSIIWIIEPMIYESNK